MVKSMTGFGRAENVCDTGKILVEMKAVNHRYLDLSVKLPRKFNCLEARIRNAVKQYAERGKVDVYITYQSFGDGDVNLVYNRHLAEAYMGFFREMSEQFGIENDIRVSNLSRMQDLFTEEQAEEDEEQLWEQVEGALKQAGERFAAQRAAEGANLKEDLLKKLDGMEQDVDFIESLAPRIIEDYKKKLTEKVKEATGSMNVDEARILTEVTIFADKVCVDEETVRLRSHINGMRKALCAESGEGVGRKLDFIAQEMNREANTTLSKCTSMDISETAVRMKTDIEKIREQVQNIE